MVIVRTERSTPKERFERLIEEFDWDEAETLFTKMGWEWSGEGVPTAKRLREGAEYLVQKVLEKGTTGLTSGRMAVSIASNGTCSLHVGVSGYAFTPRGHNGAGPTSPEQWLLGDDPV